MLLFITDTETTGLPSPEFKAQMVEFAGLLYHVETDSEVAIVQCLLYAPSNPAAHINGITQPMLDVVKTTNPGMDRIMKTQRAAAQALWDQADFIVAHNKDFDQQFLDPVFNHTTPRPWRCSKNDLRFPKAGRSRALVHLAVDHGIYPFGAHRALNDVFVIRKLLPTIPVNELIAQLQADPGAGDERFEAVGLPKERKDEAKTRGFRWDADKRVWWKLMKSAETVGLPFPVQKA